MLGRVKKCQKLIFQGLFKKKIFRFVTIVTDQTFYRRVPMALKISLFLLTKQKHLITFEP